MALGKTALYYRRNPKARAKKNAYQKKFNASRKQIARRVFDNKKNRAFGTYGNYDDLDVSHHKNYLVLEKAKKNRGSKDNTPGDKRARGKKGKGRKNKGNTGN